jgi:hypothetical protein
VTDGESLRRIVDALGVVIIAPDRITIRYHERVADFFVS